MKYFIYALGICVFFTASCKKNELSTLGADGGCISRINKSYITGSDSLAAVTLLKNNNVSAKDLRYYRVILNDTITNVNTGVATIYQHFFALQYFNGLPLFSSDLGFHFNSCVLMYSDGTRYSSINLNATPALALSQVRKIYVDEVTKNSFNSNFKDTCVAAQFGYYDLNFQVAGKTPNFVKAWNVTPKNSDYPSALFVDGSGKIIYYNSGIETLNY